MDEKNQDSIGYAFKGKIMISSITILFSACFIIVTFHVYARWCRRRRSDHHLRRVATPPAAAVATSQGLDLRAVNSLPTFVYESENQESPPECAVCLSEFEERETGRILPECKHCFHIDCIDTWLQSHRHCPLCRTRVQGQIVGNPPDSTVVSIYALESGSGLNPIEESDRIRISCPYSASSSEDPDIPKRSAGQDPVGRDLTKIEGAPDPDGSSGRTLNQDQGFRVTRFWL